MRSSMRSFMRSSMRPSMIGALRRRSSQNFDPAGGMRGIAGWNRLCLYSSGMLMLSLAETEAKGGMACRRLAHALLLIGWRVRDALLALGAVLVVVTFGHLLKDPLFPLHEHVIPRLALVLFVLCMPRADDRLSLDIWLSRKKAAGDATPGGQHEP